MTKKPTILVIGATVGQCGLVARALVASRSFAVRVLSHYPDSVAATNLQQIGAEIAEGNLHDTVSLENAMDGCYGVFGETNAWPLFQQDYTLGMNLLEAVAVCGIRHFVWHTPPGFFKPKAAAFTASNSDIQDALQSFCTDLRLPVTFIQTGLYYEDLLRHCPLRYDQFGNVQFGFPYGNAPLPMVSAEDLGRLVAGVFAETEQHTGHILTAAGAFDTCNAYARSMAKVLGIPVQYNHIPRDLYLRLGFPRAEEMTDLLEAILRSVTNSSQGFETTFPIYPALQRFENWLSRRKDQLLAQLQQQAVDLAVS